MRLTLPLVFAGQRAARALVRDNGLFTIGAQTHWTPEGWRVFIDTERPEAVTKYLSEKLPGIIWESQQTA